jgi:hypothetical protein
MKDEKDKKNNTHEMCYKEAGYGTCFEKSNWKLSYIREKQYNGYQWYGDFECIQLETEKNTSSETSKL